MHLLGGFTVQKILDGYRIMVSRILDVSDPSSADGADDTSIEWRLSVTDAFLAFGEMSEKIYPPWTRSMAFVDSQDNYYIFDFKTIGC